MTPVRRTLRLAAAVGAVAVLSFVVAGVASSADPSPAGAGPSETPPITPGWTPTWSSATETFNPLLIPTPGPTPAHAAWRASP
jgi:hypothetical protein